jgi:manganese transport protein
VVTDLREAQRLLSPLLGTSLAGVLFAVALLAAGQSSTITGTLAGQIVMQGFLQLRWSPALVRLVTRGVAVFPAVVVLLLFGEDATVPLLLATQVVLSLQLPFALVPLIRFTASRRLMGDYANGRAIVALASVAALAVVACNGWFVIDMIAGAAGVPALACIAVVGLAACTLLGYLALAPLRIDTVQAKSWSAIDMRASAARYNAPHPAGR